MNAAHISESDTEITYLDTFEIMEMRCVTSWIDLRLSLILYE